VLPPRIGLSQRRFYAMGSIIIDRFASNGFFRWRQRSESFC
jgi:hypothetical protein